MIKKTIIPFLLLSGLTLAGCASQETALSVDDELARYESLLEESDVSEDSPEVAEVSDRQAAAEEQESLAGTIEAEEADNPTKAGGDSLVNLSKNESRDGANLEKTNDDDLSKGDPSRPESISETAVPAVTDSTPPVPESTEELYAYYLEDAQVEEQVVEWVNSASPSDLQRINGIGTVHSQNIIDNRPYTSAQNIIDTPNGIGPQVFHTILERLRLTN